MDRIIESDIICTGGHTGVRYIDSEHNDIRTVCDKCGKEQYQFFGAMVRDKKSLENCLHHGCAIQTDILGKFCVFCILERTAQKLEDMGYNIEDN